MVKRGLALEQVLRFENYAWFPGKDRPADRSELIYAFEDSAADDDHIKRTGDWLIRHRSPEVCRFCPLPAEVYAAAEATKSADLAYSAKEETLGPRPGDEPFNGLHDLIDDKLRNRLKELLGSGAGARLKDVGAVK